MRKVIAAVVCALGATLALSPAALADHDEGDRVCRGFGVVGVVQEVGERTLVVAAQKARPHRFSGGELTLRVGSRTRLDGDPVAVGRTIKAHGTVCQVDEADEAVYYTKRLKVERQRIERPRGSFTLAGTVTGSAGDVLTVQVSEANVSAFVGKVVTVVIGPRTKVDGDPAPGAQVAVAGRARIVGGAAVLLATEILATGGGSSGEGSGGESEPGFEDGE
jgi:hypothetical protein